jgi:hypothetical protein
MWRYVWLDTCLRDKEFELCISHWSHDKGMLSYDQKYIDYALYSNKNVYWICDCAPLIKMEIILNIFQLFTSASWD